MKKASSAREALSLFSEGLVPLAGGTGLLRLGGANPPEEVLFDLSEALPKTVSATEVGAMATFQEVVESDEAPSWLKEACRNMASMSLRMQATIGGNIASLRDDSHIIPALLAAGAALKVIGEEGEEEIPLEEYVMEGGEGRIILSVSFPEDVKVAVKRVARSSASHAAVVAAASARGVYACVKGCGFAFGRDGLEAMEYSDGLEGSAEYKRYIALEVASMLEEAIK